MVLTGCIFTLSKQISCRMPQLGSNQHFLTKPPSRFFTWDLAGIFQPKKNFYISQLGSIPKFPSNHPWVAPSPYPFTTRAKLHHTPPAPHFYHFTPREHPSTHPTYPPYFLSPIILTLAPPRLCTTHMIYQAASVAPQVALYSYSWLDPTSGSSHECQSQIQS